MMIPIPASGIYVGVSGIEHAARDTRYLGCDHHREARAKIVQAARRRELPGFIFARAETPAKWRSALRKRTPA